jgi:hypothetical protein
VSALQPSISTVVAASQGFPLPFGICAMRRVREVWPPPQDCVH